MSRYTKASRAQKATQIYTHHRLNQEVENDTLAVEDAHRELFRQAFADCDAEQEEWMFFHDCKAIAKANAEQEEAVNRAHAYSACLSSVSEVDGKQVQDSQPVREYKVRILEYLEHTSWRWEEKIIKNDLIRDVSTGRLEPCEMPFLAWLIDTLVTKSAPRSYSSDDEW
jgi:hypothetical protein